MKWSKYKVPNEHVPFTCSCASELFTKILSTMGGSRVRSASVTGTVMTLTGLISKCCSLIGDLTRVAEVSDAWHCLAARVGPSFVGLLHWIQIKRRFASCTRYGKCSAASPAVNDYCINSTGRGLTSFFSVSFRCVLFSRCLSFVFYVFVKIRNKQLWNKFSNLHIIGTKRMQSMQLWYSNYSHVAC